MDYKALATDILKLVGGKDNIKKVNKDYTNLRFILKDIKKADKKAIEKLEGVKSVLVTDTHFNVMIGAKVVEVYKELIAITGEFKEEREVVTEGAIISAKLKNVLRSTIVQFVIVSLIYACVYFAGNMMPSNIYSFADITAMGLWIVFAAYFTYVTGKAFKVNSTLTIFLIGATVGLNIYFLNILIVLTTIILIALIDIVYYKVKK